ncbi:GspH/FimT family pseudopilin [Psychrobacter sp. F1192]|uniref:Type II secretion system protein H n=1 Tax=Psychrobacter coccoides TaxID=2818440 RepID=A0ABS3NMJ1_9GAMM|nr:GspH/FimT family pseudopilin [Psychrobacter coccoides]MBO1530308.1 GspH/FimT family pseudopilin [Psychrobacter coccoides]
MLRQSLLKSQRIAIIYLVKTAVIAIARTFSAFSSTHFDNQQSLPPTVTKNKTRSTKTFIHCRANQGFTLIEVVITTLVLAIIATIATPSILTQLANMEAKRVRHTLMNTFSTAKAESYIRRQNLVVCLSDSGGRCHKDSKKALLLFIDNNDNKHFDQTTDHLLSEQHINPKYGTLHLRAGKRHYVRFYGDSGKPRGHFGHIKYCPNKSYNRAMYQVSFNQVGIIKYKPNSIHDTGCAG